MVRWPRMCWSTLRGYCGSRGDGGDGPQIDHIGMCIGPDAAGNHRVISSRKTMNGPTFGVDRRLNGLRVFGRAVALRAEIADARRPRRNGQQRKKGEGPHRTRKLRTGAGIGLPGFSAAHRISFSSSGSARS